MDDIRQAILGKRAERCDNILKSFSDSDEYLEKACKAENLQKPTPSPDVDNDTQEDEDVDKAEDDEEESSEEAEKAGTDVTNPFQKAAEEADIEKGIYEDTAENRKLGRVGQKYGREGSESSPNSKNTSKVKVKLSDLERRVPGYLNMKEGKAYYSAKERLENNRKNAKTYQEKVNLVEEENALASKFVAYKNALKNKLSKAEDNDIEKADILHALNAGQNITIGKTGKEIKDQIMGVVLPKQENSKTMAEVDAKQHLELCGVAPTHDLNPWWSADVPVDVNYKIYKYDEMCYNTDTQMMSGITPEEAYKLNLNVAKSEEQAIARRKYNDAVEKICQSSVDIKACEILINHLKDGETYRLTPRQLITLHYN